MKKIIHFDHPGSSPVEAKRDEVHVWQFSLLVEDPDALLVYLTPEEQQRACRLRMERVRRQFIVARAGMRRLLGGYLGLPADRVPIRNTPTGRPELVDGSIDFNLSHSESIGLLAVSGSGRVGVDVERVRTIAEIDNLVTRFFAPTERERYFRLEVADRREAFFQAWTRKEAILKAIGRGVQSLDLCEVGFGPADEAVVRRLEEDSQAHLRWQMHVWEPEEGYRAAVVVERV